MITPARDRWWTARPSVPSRLRVLAFAASAVLAVWLGFLAVSPKTASRLIQYGGYYYMLGLFALFVGCAVQVLRQRAAAGGGWRGWPTGTLVMVGLATAALLWMDPYKHKVLFDEYVLQGTAFHMHVTKEVGTVIRAYDIQGTWLPIDTFLDKRPYFFTFLLSALHDLTGYRITNIYVLNTLLVPVFVALMYWFARTLVSRGAAMLSVALLATLPLLAQQATGAGMELHNLTMLLVVAVCSTLYLRVPNNERLALLIVATVLLAQSRYESVIFVFPVAAVVAIGWLRAGVVLLPATAILAPLLLMPYAWHNRIVSSTPMLWQLGEGQSSRFSTAYLADNLTGAWTFLFNGTGALPNSWYLSAIGLLGAGVALWRSWRWARQAGDGEVSAGVITLVAVGAGILANLVLLMFYYWSRFDDVVASRFALPLCLLFALLAALATAWGDARRWPATRLAAVGLAIWFVGWGIPATAQRLYTAQNLVMQELEWEHEELKKHDSSLLFITNKSTIPFVLWQIPAVINGQARSRAAQIAYHLKEGTFKEVLVAQALRPTSAEGELGIAPEDLLPPEFHLQPIAERRFGARWARLSRLVAIDALWPAPASAAATSGQAAIRSANFTEGDEAACGVSSESRPVQ